MTPRRFPPPWSVEELHTHACFVVRDDSSQKLAYVHFEDEPEAELSGKLAQQRRGKAYRGEYRQAP
jgi:hypothetical protein